MGTKLYCGNLSYGVSNADLEQMFLEFGEVRSAEVIADRDTGRSKGGVLSFEPLSCPSCGGRGGLCPGMNQGRAMSSIPLRIYHGPQNDPNSATVSTDGDFHYTGISDLSFPVRLMPHGRLVIGLVTLVVPSWTWTSTS